MVTLTYEHPLNERVRVLLRFEGLFVQLERFQNDPSSLGAKICIDTLAHLLLLLERPDLKGELLKELDRHLNQLKRWQNQPGVDGHKLQQLINQVDQHRQAIQSLPPKMAHIVGDEVLLNTIKQRALVPGGATGFDLPQLHCWLNLPINEREKTIQRWLNKLDPIQDTIFFILSLIREGGKHHQLIAEQGNFQHPLKGQNSHQLIRVKTNETAIFPELSGNKHCIHIRFLQSDDALKQKTVKNNINFELTVC